MSLVRRGKNLGTVKRKRMESERKKAVLASGLVECVDHYLLKYTGKRDK